MTDERRGRRRTALGVLVVALLLTACGDQGTTGSDAGVVVAPADSAGGAHALRAMLVASQFLVGVQRFPLGVLDHGTTVTDAAVHVRVFASIGGSAELRSDADAPFHGEGLDGGGIYVAQLHLDVPGQWLAEITMILPDATRTTNALPFRVRTGGDAPAAGQPAPRSHNPTASDVADVSVIDSGVPPDDMHAISIADAIAQHRPTLIVFATPAFCASAICAPEIHAVQRLEPAYRDRLTFVHVEIYMNLQPDPAQRELSPTVREWHLQTEPWVFLVDPAGEVSAAFEGPAATDELRLAIDRMVG
jgi:hypothetical protein